MLTRHTCRHCQQHTGEWEARLPLPLACHPAQPSPQSHLVCAHHPHCQHASRPRDIPRLGVDPKEKVLRQHPRLQGRGQAGWGGVAVGHVGLAWQKRQVRLGSKKEPFLQSPSM